LLPIAPDAPIAFHSVDRYHVPCWTKAAQLGAFDRRGQARETRERAERTRARATVARAQATQVSRCPVCWLPLANGTAVLFEAEQLVHAGCWRSPGTSLRHQRAAG
jgi:hypothetical protein